MGITRPASACSRNWATRATEHWRSSQHAPCRSIRPLQESDMHAQTEATLDVTDQIAAFKRSLAPRREALERAFVEVKDHISRAADAIREDVAAGRPVVPELQYRDINDGTVSDAARVRIRQAGCAVVRGVFPASVATGWFNELGEYLETNR